MLEALGYSLRRVRVPAQLLQLFLTLCNPVDNNPPGSSVHGIFQARIQEWVAISFPGIKPAPPVPPACPALCSPMDYSPPGSSVQGIFQARIQEWVAISFPGIKPTPPMSPALRVDSSPTEPWRPNLCTHVKCCKYGILCLHVYFFNVDCPTLFGCFCFSLHSSSPLLPPHISCPSH